MAASVRPPPMPPRGRYGKGHISDPHGLIMTPHDRLPGLAVTIPRAWDLSKKAPSIWNQLQTSSCVGQATARAISMFFRLIGDPLEDEPSGQGIYTNARAIDRPRQADGGFAPLTDDGSMPIQAMRCLTEYGVPLVKAWPFDANTINEEPNVVQEASASIIKLDGYYRIYRQPANPKAFVEAICQAIASSYPVCGAIQADQAFEDYDGHRTLGAAGASLGGHYLCFNQYDTTTGGQRILFGDNSWGTSWGTRGRFHGDEKFIAGINDVVIMRLRRLPAPVKEAA